VTFSVGDRIPADIRLITSVALEIDESALTGETRPSKKNIKICDRGEGEDTHGEGGGKALGERHCMAFMGTLVRSGMSLSPHICRITNWQVTDLGSSLEPGRTPSSGSFSR
jgi:magnesium-transporting ATPase (P-type)